MATAVAEAGLDGQLLILPLDEWPAPDGQHCPIVRGAAQLRRLDDFIAGRELAPLVEGELRLGNARCHGGDLPRTGHFTPSSWVTAREPYVAERNRAVM